MNQSSFRRRSCVSLALFSLAGLGSLATLSRGADEPKPAPADRAGVQRDTKTALVETKLPDEELGALFGEVEAFMRDYARWVLEVGPTEAAKDDAKDVVRRELEAVFESRAVALSGQTSIILRIRLIGCPGMAEYVLKR